ncbi:MAG TPA: hypothetical protein VLR50_15990 [Desulfobacterales bacterium]|nr:hypothetical protein [Desulfobacterales bacterium]
MAVEEAAVLAVEQEVAPVEEAVVPAVDRAQELGRAVAAGLALAWVRLQGQALVRVREPRSVLDLMHP